MLEKMELELAELQGNQANNLDGEVVENSDALYDVMEVNMFKSGAPP